MLISSFKKLLFHKTFSKNISLQAAIFDAMYFSIMIGLGEAYLGTFGIFLKGTSLQIGVLATLPPLIGSLFQIIGLKLFTLNIQRKKLIVVAARLQGFLWLIVAALPLMNLHGESIVWILLGLIIGHFALGNIAAPSWNSLIGDLVPEEIRGAYFGYRNQQAGWVTVLSMFLAGGILLTAKNEHFEAWGFFALFFTAGLARLASAEWLEKYEEPGYQTMKRDHFSFWAFIRHIKTSNFTKFTFFFASMNAATAIAGPYFSMYMLNDLKFSYLQFSCISAMQMITQFLTMQSWGRISDQYGNKRILEVCCIALCFNPFMWMVSPNFFILLLFHVYFGIFWAGYNLSAANFLFDAVTPAKRARCAAYMSVVNGTLVCLGALLGGGLVTYLPHETFITHGIFTPHSEYIKIFLLSGCARILVAYLFISSFREVREVQPSSRRAIVFRIVNVRPLSGATYSFVTDTLRRKKR